MTLYLDASALVELVFPERDLDTLIAAVAQADRVVTAAITLTEVSCALERARRGGLIRSGRHTRAQREVESAWPGIGRITVDDPLAREGADLGRKHGLKGYDAVHLAAAVRARQAGPVTLASWDRELLRAARVEGLATVGGQNDGA